MTIAGFMQVGPCWHLPLPENRRPANFSEAAFRSFADMDEAERAEFRQLFARQLGDDAVGRLRQRLELMRVEPNADALSRALIRYVKENTCFAGHDARREIAVVGSSDHDVVQVQSPVFSSGLTVVEESDPASHAPGDVA